MRSLNVSNQIKSGAQQNNMGNAMKQLGNAIANGIAQGNSNIFNLNMPGKPVYDVLPNPASMNFTVSSLAGSGAESKTIYIFNEDVFNENLTDNGSGADSIITSYGDGFNGHWYNQAFKTYGPNTSNGNKGVRTYGWTVQCFTISTGNQNSSIFSSMNFTWNPYNGYGKPLAETMDFSQAIRNTQFQDGILTFAFDGYISSIGQYSLELPPDTKAVFTWLNKPFAPIS